MATPVEIKDHAQLIQYAAWLESYIGTSGYVTMKEHVLHFIADVKEFGYRQTEPKIIDPNVICSKSEYAFHTYTDNPAPTVRYRYTKGT